MVCLSQARQREEAAAKKAEAKRLAAEEEAAISATKPAKSKAAKPKVNFAIAHNASLYPESILDLVVEEDRKMKKLYLELNVHTGDVTSAATGKGSQAERNSERTGAEEKGSKAYGDTLTFPFDPCLSDPDA